MYTYIYTCIHIYMYIHKHTHTHTHTHTHLNERRMLSIGVADGESDSPGHTLDFPSELGLACHSFILLLRQRLVYQPEARKVAVRLYRV